MSDTEPFELEVQSSGFSIKVRGFKPIAQVSQYLADSVGLLGEPLGTAKDALSRFRIHRAEAAVAAMQRAQDVAKSQGLEIPSDISPKFLAPWLEGASSEDLSEENILEIWAQVLASSPANFSAIHLAMVDVCRRIGPAEADYISKIVNIETYDHIRIGDDGVWRALSLANIEANNAFYMEKLFRELHRRDKLRSVDTDMISGFVSLLEKRVVGRIVGLHLLTDQSGIGQFSDPNVVQVLVFSGAAVLRDLKFKFDDDCLLFVRYIEPTSIGLRLFELLNREKLRLADSSAESSLTSIIDIAIKSMKKRRFTQHPTAFPM